VNDEMMKSEIVTQQAPARCALIGGLSDTR